MTDSRAVGDPARRFLIATLYWGTKEQTMWTWAQRAV